MLDIKEIIESLGGPAELSRKLGYGKNGVQRVANWYKRGIPSKVLVDNNILFKKYLEAKRNDGN